MGRCALVSVNGGWNLLIGADAASTGAWSPIQVPPACREVWDEAAKDECFGRAARSFIAEHPLSWAELAPRKLAATFDYCGAAGWYLHESNPAAFGERAKIALGALESAITRCVLLAALFAFSFRAPRADGGPWLGRWRFALAATGAISLFTLHGWIAYFALVVMALSSPRSLIRGPILASTAIAAIAVTMATHAVFFGSGRYSLVVLPLLCGLCALVGRSAREIRGRDRTKSPAIPPTRWPPTSQDFDKPTRPPACLRERREPMPLIETEEAARRLARAIASDLSLYNEEKIVHGIQKDDLFTALAEEVEEGRALYKSRVSAELYHKNFYDRALVDILVKSKSHIKSRIW